MMEELTSIELVRLMLRTAAQAGVDARQLAFTFRARSGAGTAKTEGKPITPAAKGARFGHRSAPGAGLDRLARQMGYASPRSARRALSRWDSGPGQAVATRPPRPPGSSS